ncbi:MAG: hypothetical protein EBT92_06190 [Planctomycetes bacterium]|nr:hypothetical protein [Planctomycetota bacterium]NBY01754.1 hypothetical protein [Planctomycetota bacterium]
MPMKPYKVFCYQPSCKNLANYKIASRWSDGGVEELKTYALACEKCLSEAFSQSFVKHKSCRTISGEILEPPMIFELQKGRHSNQLVRRTDLEASCIS